MRWTQYCMNPRIVNSALIIKKCDNKLPHRKGPSKLLFTSINCGKTLLNLHLILVSGSWAHAMDPVLPEDQMTQTETSVLPNQCHLIKIK